MLSIFFFICFPVTIKGGAAQKRIDNIDATLAKWEADEEKYAKQLANTKLYRRRDEFKKQLAQYNKDLAAGTGKPDTGSGYITTKTQDRGGYTGPRTYDFDRAALQRSGGQRASRNGFTDPGKGSYGPHMAQGGRIGLYGGGDAEDYPENESENIFEIMQDQNIPFSEQVEAGPTEEQVAMVIDMDGKGIDMETISSVTQLGKETIMNILGVEMANGGIARLL